MNATTFVAADAQPLSTAAECMLLMNLSSKIEEAIMNDKFVPRINCRFKIRQDLNSFLGFFQGKGVLTLNEVGTFIVSQMTGGKNLREIGQSVKDVFPAVENPLDEVLSIARQLRESGFF